VKAYHFVLRTTEVEFGRHSTRKGQEVPRWLHALVAETNKRRAKRVLVQERGPKWAKSIHINELKAPEGAEPMVLLDWWTRGLTREEQDVIEPGKAYSRQHAKELSIGRIRLNRGKPCRPVLWCRSRKNRKPLTITKIEDVPL